MARDISPEEAREEEIAARTEKHLAARRALLSSGDERLTSGVCEALSVALTVPLWEGMVQLCVTEPAIAGAALAKVVDKVLRADAEADSIREVEQLEQAAKNDPDNYRPKTRAVAAFLARQG